jgi:hypothetical protein
MKFSAAVLLAAAAGANAYYGSNVTVVTEVVDTYTTYCPGPTTITHGSKTYTVTEATTLTITDCPCTITKPVYTATSVYCHTCTETPVVQPPPTGGYTPVKPAPGKPTDVPASAGKAAALSGAGLVGVLAAFVL